MGRQGANAQLRSDSTPRVDTTQTHSVGLITRRSPIQYHPPGCSRPGAGITVERAPSGRRDTHLYSQLTSRIGKPVSDGKACGTWDHA